MKNKSEEKIISPIRYHLIRKPVAYFLAEEPYVFLTKKSIDKEKADIVPKVEKEWIVLQSRESTPQLSIKTLSKIFKAENISFKEEELINYAKNLNLEELLTLSHFIKDFDIWLKKNKLRAELLIRDNNIFIYIQFPMNVPDEIIDKKMSEAYKILYKFFETLTFINIAADFIEKE